MIIAVHGLGGEAIRLQLDEATGLNIDLYFLIRCSTLGLPSPGFVPSRSGSFHHTGNYYYYQV